MLLDGVRELHATIKPLSGFLFLLCIESLYFIFISVLLIFLSMFAIFSNLTCLFQQGVGGGIEEEGREASHVEAGT